MTLTAVVLAALALCLAEPVSRLLAAARWPHRAPRPALVLWQAVGLAAGLAATGAGVVYAVTPLGAALPGGMAVLWHDTTALRPFHGMDVPHAAALLAAAALAARLAGVLLAVGVATLRQRRRHRHLLDLVGTPAPRLADTVVLDHPAAVAYCLPGIRPRIVLSAGALELLDEDHLDGVVAHERAHLGARHDLVVLPFVAWAAALPFVPGVRRARTAVATLVEMLADDHARHRCGPRRLAAAIAAVGGTGAPAGALALDGSPVLARVARLLDPPPPAGAALRAAVYTVAVLLVGVPTAILFLPGL